MNNELLDKYLSGITTPEERIKILRWVEASGENRAKYKTQRRLYDASLIYEKPRRSRSKFLRNYAWALSAALVLLIGIFLGINYLNKPQATLQYAQAQAAKGEQFQMTLSDGTTVLLNSGSSLEVIESSYNERRVKLHGEAFFNVARDPEHPFIVETSKIQVKVLGTSFNVNAYNDNQSIVLVSGLVNVVDNDNTWIQYMSPDQKFSYNAQNGKRVIEPVNATDCISWRDGYLKLQKESLSEILLYLQNYYDVSIEFNRHRADTILISGKLELSKGLKEAISYISRAASVDYEFDENDIKVSLR